MRDTLCKEKRAKSSVSSLPLSHRQTVIYSNTLENALNVFAYYHAKSIGKQPSYPFYSEKITRYATNADCNLAEKGNLPANKGNIVVKCSENYPKTFRRLEV